MEFHKKRDLNAFVIERNLLIATNNNGFPKVITGIRHCGKSYLLSKIYKQYLIDNGISNSNIIEIDLTKISNAYYRKPIKIGRVIK